MVKYNLPKPGNFMGCPEYKGRQVGPGFCMLAETLCWVDSLGGECTYLDEYEIELIKEGEKEMSIKVPKKTEFKVGDKVKVSKEGIKSSMDYYKMCPYTEGFIIKLYNRGYLMGSCHFPVALITPNKGDYKCGWWFLQKDLEKVEPKKTSKEIEIDIERFTDDDGTQKVKVLAIRNCLLYEQLPKAYTLGFDWYCFGENNNRSIYIYGSLSMLRYTVRVGSSYNVKDWDNLIVPALKECGKNLIAVKKRLAGEVKGREKKKVCIERFKETITI